MGSLLRQCPACGGVVENTPVLRRIGETVDGTAVMGLSDMFVCTACEWAAPVKSVEFREWLERERAGRARGRES